LRQKKYVRLKLKYAECMYTTSIEMLLHDYLLTQIYLFNKIKKDTYKSVKPKPLKEILPKRLITIL